MIDVMVDIETLGTSPGCVVLQIGAVTFDGTSFQSEGGAFQQQLAIFPQIMAGLSVDNGTAAWWSRQSREAQLAVSSAAVHPREALEGFSRWLGDVDPRRLWARGPQFDQVNLEALYRAFGLEIPWQYNQWCDLRTVLRVAGDMGCLPKNIKATVEHVAMDDCEAQILHLQDAVEYLRRPER